MIALLDRARAKPPPLYEVKEGQLSLNFHTGQAKAWNSPKRVVCLFCGKQSGKTTFLPWWLWREIYDPHIGKGAGDYLAITANFPLFNNKFLPELIRVFVKVLAKGRYWPAKQVIELAESLPDGSSKFWAKEANDDMWGRILLGSAQAASRLVSTTANGAIIDEAGLPDYTINTWEEIDARMGTTEGRICVGTTLYDLGWMKTTLYDPWAEAQRHGQAHPEIDLIQFDSTANPAFSKAFFDKKRKEMPAWKFDMAYRGRYTRPAGAIYDCFDTEKHVVKPFPIPKEWPRYGGLDFGGVHTAGVYLAEDPKSSEQRDLRKLYIYREYMAGNRTATDHKQAMMRGEPPNIRWFGGSQSEEQWRAEFKQAGMRVAKPDEKLRDVEVGIDRVYKEIVRNRLYVFDTCKGTIQNLQDYSRELDDYNEPTDDIKDKKTYHLADGLRYALGSLKKARWEPIGYDRSPF